MSLKKQTDDLKIKIKQHNKIITPNFLDFLFLYVNQYDSKLIRKKISNPKFPEINDFNHSIIINKSKDFIKFKLGSKKFNRLYIMYYVQNNNRIKIKLNKISILKYIKLFNSYSLNSKTFNLFIKPLKKYKKKFIFFNYKKCILKFFVYKKKNIALIENIITPKNLRKRGFASNLIQNILKTTNHGMVTYLICEKKNINFYKKNKFQILKTKIYKNF